ncbi:MAG: trans-sulfuration enzyme family protein [Bacillota bacterium]
MPKARDTSIATRAAHAGETWEAGPTVPVSMPIYQTSVFAFEDLDQLDAMQSGRLGGYMYTRMGSPNAAALAQAVADLESAPAGVTCASGMGAIFAALFSLCGAGSHLVLAGALYGGTHTLVVDELGRAGVRATLLEEADPAAIDRAIGPDTRAVYLETITNPTLRVADLPAVAEVCRSRGVPLVVDNTFATPVLCRPYTLGASLVVHSATKYLGGHGDLTLGLIAGDRGLVEAAAATSVRTGATPDPFGAWLCLRGLKTLEVRVRRQAENAAAVAAFLAAHPKVVRVHYPGLADHPDRAVADRVLDGGGAMLSFVLPGGLDEARRFVQALQLCRLVPSLGETGTTVSHPVLTSHRGLPEEQRRRLGIVPGMVRLSAGLEASADILEDLEQALRQV